jgi:hypothetical protein
MMAGFTEQFNVARGHQFLEALQNFRGKPFKLTYRRSRDRKRQSYILILFDQVVQEPIDWQIAIPRSPGKYTLVQGVVEIFHVVTDIKESKLSETKWLMNVKV